MHMSKDHGVMERVGLQSYEISKHRGCLKFLEGNIHITLFSSKLEGKQG